MQVRAIRSVAFLCALVMSGAVDGASADVVAPPPLDCARGLRPSTSHGGPYCAFDLCDAVHSCTDGLTCTSRSFCVALRPGMSIDGPFTEEIATIPCAADAECGGGRCRTADVCLDVEAHRLRGLVLLAIGLVCFGVVAVLALMSARSRRRPRS